MQPLRGSPCCCLCLFLQLTFLRSVVQRRGGGVNRRLYTKLFANQHTQLCITSTQPTHPVLLQPVRATKSVLPLAELTRSLEALTAIRLFSTCNLFTKAGWRVNIQVFSWALDKSNLFPLGEADLASTASTGQRRALKSPSRVGKKGMHLPQHFTH